MPYRDHVVAVFGGAVSGAEAAWQLAQRGVRVVVFEQNALPYGKIEDGLPKWHVRLRDREEARIDEKLTHPNVTFVPCTRLGRDLDFEDVARNWGFSAILLATGAWRDRPLPVPGIDEYVGKGLVYQNTFMYWFNHMHEPDYAGPQVTIEDGAIVVGGGLASIDVCKAIMMTLVEARLRERGIETNLFELDKGIDRVLEAHGLTFEELGLRGCTLYYRRRIEDMPLTPMDTSTPELLAKARAVRRKVAENAMRKFFFRIEPQHVPVDKIVEGDRLVGLVFRRTRVTDEGRLEEIPGSEREVRAPLIVSSIGSVPEVIGGIPMQGQTYKLVSNDCCMVEGFDNVFAIGNAVTGRGNINESMKHGRAVSEALAEWYLCDGEEAISDGIRATEDRITGGLARILRRLGKRQPPDEATRQRIFERVRALQEKVGYDGDYAAWVARHKPVRLEELLSQQGSPAH